MMQILTLRARSLPLLFASCLAFVGGPSSDCLAGDSDTVSGWSFEKSLPTHFKDYGHEVVSATEGHPVRAGKQSIRFEIRAGDCGWNRYWNDCTTDRERHELSTATRNTRTTWSSGEKWYHWSIFFPEDHPVIHPALLILGQFHQIDSYPVWLFHNGPGGGYYVVNFTTGKPVGGFKRVLTDSEMRGKWTDVLTQCTGPTKTTVFSGCGSTVRGHPGFRGRGRPRSRTARSISGLEFTGHTCPAARVTNRRKSSITMK